MSTPGPVLGPCVSWCEAADVAACCGVSVEDCVGPSSFDTVAWEASMALYELSGRRFNGGCERTVRPCRDLCGCWPPSSGLGPWYWTAAAWGVAPTGLGWWWTNECGDRCGCGPLSKVDLPGYPVTEILEVKIDGDVLPAVDANGNPNYRLDRWEWLVRMDDPTNPGMPRRWPSCQNLALDETQPGTFAVTYRWGVAPPQLGIDAAAQLACELYKACGGGGSDCQLPTNTIRVQRQGVTVERNLLLAFLGDRTKPTGLPMLDLFLGTYWPTGRGRRPAVSSPDLLFARKVGP